eukprot:gnl/TRDRNA2_/TRDRNA2_168384_c1_seq1.p2 gnl/TRDRNA2_/TRDRNA2_168384_c1~~gnl/TRDRNA2_/TRDRNA2_168384_c1_seq1.p2  ORF type:complete len:320 (+),score=133.00 gnl/TRDRNA2_/TRDRNA2_168384_c1_seq1:74-1033(+)
MAKWAIAAGVALGLLSTPACASPSARTSLRIWPELSHPQGDKKFFGKDYPRDQRPKVVEKPPFNHPYPAVQDHEDYEVDYVKDENDDKGAWHTQEVYDALKNKLGAQKAGLAGTKAKAEQEKKEYEWAKKKEAEAEAAAKEKEQMAQQAANMEGSNNTAANTANGGVRANTKEVEEEMKDLEECKKQLADTRAKLKELVEKTEKAEQEKKEADAAMESADKEEAAAEKLEEEAQEKLKVETTEAAVAKDGYKAQIKELKKTESDLEKAEKRLRKYRMKVDHKGGVYRPTDEPAPPKAGAPAAAFVSMLAASVAALALLF